MPGTRMGMLKKRWHEKKAVFWYVALVMRGARAFGKDGPSGFRGALSVER